MWGYVKDNKVEEIIRFPRTFIDTENNIKHPKAIFNTWTWEQLNTIGIYEVIDNGTKGNDMFEYTSQPTYTFSSKNKNITTNYTIHEKLLDDENAKNEDGSDMKDPITGEQVINYGLKTQAIEQTKRTANSLISRFNWLVERSIYDSSKTIPKELSDYVSSIRADSDAIETAVTNCKTLDELKELYNDEYNEDGTIKTQNRMGRWTDDKTVKEYIR